METQIIEGNKLIAEFMEFPTAETAGRINDDAAKYHSSWDWLMPVVEKIGKSDFGSNEPLASVSLYSPIYLVWKNVVEAIKDYNKNSNEYLVAWVETEAYEKKLTVKASSPTEAIEKVREMRPTEADSSEFLHHIDQLRDSFVATPVK